MRAPVVAAWEANCGARIRIKAVGSGAKFATICSLTRSPANAASAHRPLTLSDIASDAAKPS